MRAVPFLLIIEHEWIVSSPPPMHTAAVPELLMLKHFDLSPPTDFTQMFCKETLRQLELTQPDS